MKILLSIMMLSAPLFGTDKKKAFQLSEDALNSIKYDDNTKMREIVCGFSKRTTSFEELLNGFLDSAPSEQINLMKNLTIKDFYPEYVQRIYFENRWIEEDTNQPNLIPVYLHERKTILIDKNSEFPIDVDSSTMIWIDNALPIIIDKDKITWRLADKAKRKEFGFPVLIEYLN